MQTLTITCIDLHEQEKRTKIHIYIYIFPSVKIAHAVTGGGSNPVTNLLKERFEQYPNPCMQSRYTDCQLINRPGCDDLAKKGMDIYKKQG